MKKGFTLIEILVVVTIIGILTAIAMVSYSSINKRSRDAKRKSDLEQIRAALELYRADNGAYPFMTGVNPNRYIANMSYLSSVGYLNEIPNDPKNASDSWKYDYQVQQTADCTNAATAPPDKLCKNYWICANVEGTSDANNICPTPGGTNGTNCKNVVPTLTCNFGHTNP